MCFRQVNCGLPTFRAFLPACRHPAGPAVLCSFFFTAHFLRATLYPELVERAQILDARAEQAARTQSGASGWLARSR